MVARHGQTAWNATGRFQGQGDPPLDATGRRQARRLAAALAPLTPAAVTSSDLRRARQTAEAVAEACGLTVSTHTGLREVDLGGWQGLDHLQAAKGFPDEYRAWREGNDVRRGGGETEAEAGRRAAEVMAARIDASEPGSTLVVVAHGLVLRRALGLLAASETLRLDGSPPHLANGDWLAFDLSAG